MARRAGRPQPEALRTRIGRLLADTRAQDVGIVASSEGHAGAAGGQAGAGAETARVGAWRLGRAAGCPMVEGHRAPDDGDLVRQ